MSTGISPWAYPLPPVPIECWQRLPESGDGLETVASHYYGSPALLPVAGSQEAIGLLASLRLPSRVGILSPAYHSHCQAWRKRGHDVHELTVAQLADSLPTLDVLIAVNPTNPTAQSFTITQLQQWHEVLTKRGGWLVVDEAFRDANPTHSLIQPEPLQGLLVLRSIGKFFGLAGIRLGFVWAQEQVLNTLAALQDDWSVSHPARWAGRLALADRAWQQQQRVRLQTAARRLHRLLLTAYGVPVERTNLFAYLRLENAHAEYERLARLGILVRFFPQPAALRFGLPGNEAEWMRLEAALLQ